MKNIKIKTEFQMSKVQLEMLVTAQLGKSFVITDFEIESSGDYDRGNYRKNLVNITFTNTDTLNNE